MGLGLVRGRRDAVARVVAGESASAVARDLGYRPWDAPPVLGRCRPVQAPSACAAACSSAHRPRSSPWIAAASRPGKASGVHPKAGTPIAASRLATSWL